MPKRSLTNEQIDEIVSLRKTGHSLPEIRRITGRANGSVFKYIKGVKVLARYRGVLKSKQGGSKERARIHWQDARDNAGRILDKFSDRDKLIFLLGIYWGEGSKGDFNLINGDPYLIKAFIHGLITLGVNKNDIRLNFRIFSNMDKEYIINFWTRFLNISRKQVGWFEIVKSNGSTKLKYGMCRVRIAKGGKHFKLVLSMIDFIKLNMLS